MQPVCLSVADVTGKAGSNRTSSGQCFSDEKLKGQAISRSYIKSVARPIVLNGAGTSEYDVATEYKKQKITN